MAGHFTKAQVDRLGERLRRKDHAEDELKALDEYRRTFGSAYDRVVETLQRILNVPVSGRPAKSTTSVVEKLHRESIRLSQMQDIAGCRVVVSDVTAQNETVDAIKAAFSDVTVLDRRLKPSHGYRAVHVVVRQDDKPVEIQIRTALQHVWAEISEKCADIADPSIKYGGGSPEVRDMLDKSAKVITKIEGIESTLAGKLPQELRDARDEYVANLQFILRNFERDMED